MRTKAEINVKVNARSLNDLDRSMERAFNPARAENMRASTDDLNTTVEETSGSARDMADAFQDASETTKQFSKLRQELIKIRQEAKRTASELQKIADFGGSGRAGGLGGGGGGGMEQPKRRSMSGALPGSAQGQVGGGSNNRDKAFGHMASAISAIPYAGMALGGMLMLGGQAYSSHIQRETARRGSYAGRFNNLTGAPLDAGLVEGAGIQFGYNPAETNAMFSQFAQAGGLATGANFLTAMGAQQNRGVDLSTSAQFMAAAIQGGQADAGDKTSADTQFRRALGTAVKQGLDGSFLSKRMDDTASLMQEQVNLGNRAIDSTILTQQTQGVFTGIGGDRQAAVVSGNIVAGFARGVSEKGFAGAGGATEFALASAAGYRPGQGMDAYFKALQKMQDPMKNPRLMQGYLRRFLMSGSRAGSATETAMIQRALSEVGVKVHSDTAARLAQSVRDGSMEQGRGTYTDSLMLQGVSKDLIAEAGFEAERADVGQTLAPAMQSLTKASISMMKVMDSLAPIIKVAAGQVETVAALAEQMAGLIEGIAELVETLNILF